MGKKKRKFLKRILLILCLLIASALVTNWYLKHRLETFLQEMLSQKVLDSTEGFYTLSFKHLSIDLFSGELSIEDISFIPDSAKFSELKDAKLLPETYFKVNVGSIYFKGINLTWRFNYKKLLFKLFEIKNANVEIYNTKLEASVGGDTVVQNQSIYAMISPFINVLSVDQINLENSSVLFFTDDGINPVCYGLKNIKFSAYNFLLNEDSEESGELLYSEHFNFESTGEQTLLANTQFRLNTQQIRFDTRDSIIQIKEIEIRPQKELWERIKKIPDSYIDGRVKSIELEGVVFKRDSAINRFNAKSFNINKSYFEYVNQQKDLNDKITKDLSVPLKSDSLNLSWSLYSILSPVFSKVSIQEIGINEARLKYLQIQGQDTSLYTLDNFKLTALGFLVDSISDKHREHRFLYSDNFGLLAKGIEGVNVEKNYHFNVGSMVLSTTDKRIRLDSITVTPITKQTPNDYIVGSIESIDIDSLYYNLGLDAGILQINSPQIEYVKAPLMYRTHHQADSVAPVKVVKGTSVWTQSSSFFNHLSVTKIEVNNANITFSDNSHGSKYKLSNLNFLANNIFVDQQTINTSYYLTAAKNFEINFDSFESVLSGGLYQVKSGYGMYNRNRGVLRLDNINLIPLPRAKKHTNKYYRASIRSIDGDNIKALLEEKVKTIDIGSFNIHTPYIEVVTNSVKTHKDVLNSKSSSDFNTFLESFKINNLNILNAQFKDIDIPNSDTTNVLLKAFTLRNSSWSRNMPLSFQKLELIDPVISIVQNRKNKTVKYKEDAQVKQLPKFLTAGIRIDKFQILNMNTKVKAPLTKLESSMPNFTLTDFVWNPDLLSLGEIKIAKTNTEIRRSTSLSNQTDTVALSKKSEQDIYDKLGQLSKVFNVKKIDIVGANLDYFYAAEDSPHKHQRLNETNLFVTDLEVDNWNKSYEANDIKLEVSNFNYPLDNGFYTLNIDKILIDSKTSKIKLDSIALIPAYPKEIFAYKQPKHKDWFDVTVGNVQLAGVNFPEYFKTKEIYVDSVFVKDVFLQNFKNQKIPIEHRPMPMLYAGLQNAPFKTEAKVIDVKNFGVVYEELPKKGNIASKIFFTNMNGHIEGLTNKATSADQMYRLKADGYLMGTGYFTADWYLPVAYNYDCFVLNAELGKFDLRELNQLVVPMAPVRIDSGFVKKVTFKTEANSLGASIDMLMLYNDLNLTVQKSLDNDNPNKLFTRVVNRVLKANNPKKPNSKPRHAHAEIIRDPDHSTFNYIWQILQPPLVETVGVSQRSQKFIKKVTDLIATVKTIFGRKKNKTIEPHPENDGTEIN